MRYIFLVFALLISVLVGATGYPQQSYSIVYDLYLDLMLYPENGDKAVRINQKLFGSKFYQCLNRVEERAQHVSYKHIEYCNQFADPRANRRCMENNEGGKLVNWTRTVRSATRGEVTWSQTLMARAAVTGKSALESINPGQYEKIVRSTVPKWKPMMLCQ